MLKLLYYFFDDTEYFSPDKDLLSPFAEETNFYLWGIKLAVWLFGCFLGWEALVNNRKISLAGSGFPLVIGVNPDAGDDAGLPPPSPEEVVSTSESGSSVWENFVPTFQEYLSWTSPQRLDYLATSIKTTGLAGGGDTPVWLTSLQAGGCVFAFVTGWLLVSTYPTRSTPNTKLVPFFYRTLPIQVILSSFWGGVAGLIVAGGGLSYAFYLNEFESLSELAHLIRVQVIPTVVNFGFDVNVKLKWFQRAAKSFFESCSSPGNVYFPEDFGGNGGGNVGSYLQAGSLIFCKNSRWRAALSLGVGTFFLLLADFFFSPSAVMEPFGQSVAFLWDRSLELAEFQLGLAENQLAQAKLISQEPPWWVNFLSFQTKISHITHLEVRFQRNSHVLITDIFQGTSPCLYGWTPRVNWAQFFWVGWQNLARSEQTLIFSIFLLWAAGARFIFLGAFFLVGVVCCYVSNFIFLVPPTHEHAVLFNKRYLLVLEVKNLLENQLFLTKEKAPLSSEPANFLWIYEVLSKELEKIELIVSRFERTSAYLNSLVCKVDVKNKELPHDYFPYFVEPTKSFFWEPLLSFSTLYLVGGGFLSGVILKKFVGSFRKRFGTGSI